MATNTKYLISFIFIVLFLSLLLVFMSSYENGDEGMIYYPEIFDDATNETAADVFLDETQNGLVVESLEEGVSEEIGQEIFENNEDIEKPIALEDDLESDAEIKVESELEPKDESLVETVESSSPKMMIVIERD